LRYLAGGGYTWLFLNWALGLRAIGCTVVWLDSVAPGTPPERIAPDVAELRRRLTAWNLAERLVVVRPEGSVVAGELDDAAGADLLIDLGYDLPDSVIGRFRRSAFVDLDPGLTQTWLHRGQLALATHDAYFTLGETVGRPGSAIPDGGVRWLYTPPPVFVAAWRAGRADPDAAFTSVSSWWGDWIEIDGAVIDNSKRAAFLACAALARRTSAPLELAIPLTDAEDPTGDLSRLRRQGWRVRHAAEVGGTPDAYRAYVHASLGELSCLKRGYQVLETAWTGERTLAYLASGRPAVVQHTGPSRFLPDAEGLLRFRDLAEAARHLESVQRDWDRHSRCARALVAEYFDAERVVAGVLERAL
jgi:hypothetical protein